MRRALVVALHDGFYSAATGAGLSNQALLAAPSQSTCPTGPTWLSRPSTLTRPAPSTTTPLTSGP